MTPVTELEMATNTTFASILYEIQLSNLNFSIKVTPFAAYITLKKTLQKNLNGTISTPAPPICFLLQNTQEQNFHLGEQTSKLKSIVDTLEKKLETVEHENMGLNKIVEETRRDVDDITKTNNNLHERIDEAEKVIARKEAEKTEILRKFNEMKKKHVLEQKDLSDQIKELKIAKKTNEKQNYDLNETLVNARETLKHHKAEKSQLKICKTKLEVKVRKLEEHQQKGSILRTIKSEIKDENANMKSFGQVVVSDFGFLPSMVSHYNPNIFTTFQGPASTTTMIAHFALSPPPDYVKASSTDEEKQNDEVDTADFKEWFEEFREQLRADRAKIIDELRKDFSMFTLS